MSKDDLVSLLADARELMNDEGKHWTQGVFSRRSELWDRDSYCMVGAIEKVASGGNNWPLRRTAYVALAAQIVWNDGSRFYRPGEERDFLIRFNDRDSTTWEKVDSAFRKAIEAIESEA